MAYFNEDWVFDWDGAEFDDTLVLDYIMTRLISYNCVPKWVTPRPSEGLLENLPQIEQRLVGFESILSRIKFPVTLEEFIKDKELKARVDKFNEKHRTNDNEIKLEPLYYLTLYVYNIVNQGAFDDIVIEKSRYSQFTDAMFITSREGAEITFKLGKEKIVITDRKLIDFIFDVNRIADTAKDEDIKMLHSSNIYYDKDAKKLSYTDASSYFTGLMFEYFEQVNLSKGIIAYLLYLSEWVSNDSILANNDYINGLWSTYNKIKLNDKKKIHTFLYT